MTSQPELVRAALKYGSRPGFNATPLPALEVVRSDRPTGPEYAVARPVLCLIVQGAKEISVAGKLFHYDPSHYLVTSVAVPLVGRVTSASAQAPYLCLVLTLEQAAIYDVLSRSSAPLRPTSRRDYHGAVFVEAVQPSLGDAFLRLLQSLDEPHERDMLAPLYVREILFRLLTSPYSATVREVGTAGSPTRRIGKAIDVLRANFTRPLRVASLARASGMGLASFHQHFKQITTLSPLQFQKQLRLHEARRLLLAEALDAASAGYQVGYESPSQFSREYARLFGLPPREDVKRFIAQHGGG
ncbi:AraC family transcriptional regulator [Chondromyces crocatus]|uniref:AraC family transcriptional regulator n=1 Tax=Chondromyces crocatus TaxID=52 RepID=A0A0K1EK01_CHOCO|nr:AraC family transcriptional regulator [Chondromyces crocatus]AKT41179.1 AraC family transcriptional regulator [Chondromyces crocatus]